MCIRVHGYNIRNQSRPVKQEEKILNDPAVVVIPSGGLASSDLRSQEAITVASALAH